jgi:hypothetical protein
LGHLALIVARDFFPPFMGFLRFDRHRGDRAGNQAAESDRFAGNLAEAIFTLFDAPQR